MRNKETRKRLINSTEQVEVTFRLLSDNRQIDELNRGIYQLLDKLVDTEVRVLFERYPRLIQKYSIKQLLSGKANIPNTNSQCLKIAGLLTCLQFLISSFPEFVQQSGHLIPLKEIENSDFYQAENYMIASISLDDYLEEIFLTILSVTGEEYYQKFTGKIGNINFTLDDTLKLENDIELQEHIELMAWFGVVRLLLESLYFYFNPENHNPKN